MSAGATDCTDPAIGAACGMWPDKTAAHWAAAAGAEVRIAKYWLSGSHPVSERARLAIVRHVLSIPR